MIESHRRHRIDKHPMLIPKFNWKSNRRQRENNKKVKKSNDTQ